jgi:hypothetical protein
MDLPIYDLGRQKLGDFDRDYWKVKKIEEVGDINCGIHRSTPVLV